MSLWVCEYSPDQKAFHVSTLDLRTDFYRRGFNPVESNVLWREELEGRLPGISWCFA